MPNFTTLLNVIHVLSDTYLQAMVVCILCIVKGKSTLTVAGRDSVSFKTEVLRFVTYLINSSKRCYLKKITDSKEKKTEITQQRKQITQIFRHPQAYRNQQISEAGALTFMRCKFLSFGSISFKLFVTAIIIHLLSYAYFSVLFTLFNVQHCRELFYTM